MRRSRFVSEVLHSVVEVARAHIAENYPDAAVVEISEALGDGRHAVLNVCFPETAAEAVAEALVPPPPPQPERKRAIFPYSAWSQEDYRTFNRGIFP